MILNVSDIFPVAWWKLYTDVLHYYTLMNKKLPVCFSFMKPDLPIVTERYDVQNPSFHTPAIKHKFVYSVPYSIV